MKYGRLLTLEDASIEVKITSGDSVAEFELELDKGIAEVEEKASALDEDEVELDNIKEDTASMSELHSETEQLVEEKGDISKTAAESIQLRIRKVTNKYNLKNSGVYFQFARESLMDGMKPNPRPAVEGLGTLVKEMGETISTAFKKLISNMKEFFASLFMTTTKAYKLLEEAEHSLSNKDFLITKRVLGPVSLNNVLHWGNIVNVGSILSAVKTQTAYTKKSLVFSEVPYNVMTNIFKSKDATSLSNALDNGYKEINKLVGVKLGTVNEPLFGNGYMTFTLNTEDIVDEENPNNTYTAFTFNYVWNECKTGTRPTVEITSDKDALKLISATKELLDLTGKTIKEFEIYEQDSEKYFKSLDDKIKQLNDGSVGGLRVALTKTIEEIVYEMHWVGYMVCRNIGHNNLMFARAIHETIQLFPNK